MGVPKPKNEVYELMLFNCYGDGFKLLTTFSVFTFNVGSVFRLRDMLN